MRVNVRRRRRRCIFFVCAVSAAALLVLAGFRLVPESTPVARGAALAYMQGCIGCHGQTANTATNDAALDCSKQHAGSSHPRYAGDCRDLLAYFEAVRVKRSFELRTTARNPNRLLQGELLARRYSCFQCHGELGQGGFRNEGALKGYIPGYFGNDFALLTHDGHADSVRAWIQRGIDRTLFEPPILGPIAKFFIGRQAVSMPKFETLPDSELRILTDYVFALNQFGPMGATEIRTYRRLTQ